LDFRFSIVGLKTNKSKEGFLFHGFPLNPKSKIGNPKLFFPLTLSARCLCFLLLPYFMTLAARIPILDFRF